MKNNILWVFVSLALMLTSCSDDDYLNAIPANSIALLSVDLQQFLHSSGQDGEKASLPLSQLLGANANEECGVDISSKLFFFESQDGALGMVGRVASRKQAEQFIEHLAESGTCQQPASFRGNTFTVLKGSWVVGIGDNALVVMGPVLPAQQTETISQINGYLKQHEEQGIKASPLMQRIESMKSSVALVAQADALPEMMAAPFTLGTPPKTDSSDILIAAEIESANGCLLVNGNTFSTSMRVDEALEDAKKMFRPLAGTFNNLLSGSDFCSLMLNAKGSELLGMIQKNRSLTTLLNGINTAIDMNKILQGVDGEVLITAHNTAPALSIHAQMVDDSFLKDVDYWMESCPPGASIRRDAAAANAFAYQDKNQKLLFKVTPDKLFEAQLIPNGGTAAAPKQPDQDLLSCLKGEKMCLMINLDGLGGDETVRKIKSVLAPITGDISTIICRMR